MRFSLLLAVILFSCQFSFSQKGWGAGACGIYNFNEKAAGMGARVLVPVKSKFWAVPYIYYYFPTHEFSGGLSVMVPFYNYEMFTFYGVASGTIRAEVSVTVNDSTTNQSTSNKADGEIGAGVMIGNGCLKGMIEPRYSTSNEFTLRAGVIYFLSCKAKKKTHGRGPKKKKWREGDYSNVFQRAYCPAYN
jgi:hypothetical protein